MKFDRAYREVSQLSMGIIGVFCILSLVFVGSYLYVDYQRYLASYKTTQQSELKEAQAKTNMNVDNIKKLSVLTGKRISAVSGNIKRIQNILISTHSLLPDRDFLKLQKVTYEKLSQPQRLITRFGVVPLESDKHSLNSAHDGNSSIIFDKDRVYSKTIIFTQENLPDGILEIHVPFSHFKETLRVGPTLSFVSDASYIFLQKDPFPIYGKLPKSFWNYLFQNMGLYTIFPLFIFFTIIFIGLSNIYSRFRIKQDVREELETLMEEIAEWKMECHKANDALLTYQKQGETHQVTCQSHKQFQTSFQHHQREQLNHVLRCVDVVVGSLQNPNAALPTQELIDILKSCLHGVEGIVSGSLSASKHEPIKVIKILSNVRSLFTEKMYKSDLTMDLHCPENLTYYGDPLLLEFILLNLIGKPLYMARKNGRVEIRATEQVEGLHIQVKDNGFPMNDKSQKQIKQAFDLFISDDLFQHLCQENGFYCQYAKGKDGLNKAEIVFPNVLEESPSNNVIPLFNKM